MYSFENVIIETKPLGTLTTTPTPICFPPVGPGVADFSPLIKRPNRRVAQLGEARAPVTYSSPVKRMVTTGKIEKAWGFIHDSVEEEGCDPDEKEILYSHWSFVMEYCVFEKDPFKDALDTWFDGS